MQNLSPLKESNQIRTTVFQSPLKKDPTTVSIFNLIQEQLHQHSRTISQQSIEQHKLKMEQLETEYQEQLIEKSYEINELKKVNAILNREVENYQFQLAQSQRNQNQQDQNHQLNILKAEDEIKSLNTIIAKQHVTIEGLNRQIESLQVLIENEKELGRIRDRESQILQELVSELQQRLTDEQDLKREIQTLNSKLTSEQELNSQLQSRLDHFNRIDSPYQQIRECQEKLVSTVLTSIEQERALNNTINQLNSTIEEKNILQEQVEALRQQVSELEKHNLMQGEALSSCTQNLELQLKKNEIDNIRLDELSQGFQSISNSLESTNQMLEETKQKLQRSKDTEHRLKESYRQAVIRIEEISAKIITQGTQELKLKAMSQQLQERMEEITELKNEIKKMKSDAQNKLCELKFDYQEVAQIKLNQEKQIDQLKEKCTSLTAQIDLMNFFKLRNIELEVKNQQLQAECDKKLQKRKSKDFCEEGKILELEDQIQKQNIQISNLIAELQQTQTKLSQNEQEYEKNQRDMIQKHKAQIQEIMNSSQVQLENIKTRMESAEKAKRSAIITKRSFLN